MRNVMGMMLLAVIPIVSDASQSMESVQSLQWDYRIIFVRNDRNPQGDVALLQQQKADIDDRDITWFVFYQDKVVTNYIGMLSDKFLQEVFESYVTQDQHVVLVGRDGGIKAKDNKLELERLLALIDTMPMRRMEILRNN